MKTQGPSRAFQLLIALAALSLAAGQSIAQNAMRECTGTPQAIAAGKKGECVEFTVRYYKGGNVEIADAESKDSERCTIGKDCKLYGSLLRDVKSVTLMQTNTHWCYMSCTPTGGCVRKCPVH